MRLVSLALPRYLEVTKVVIDNDGLPYDQVIIGAIMNELAVNLCAVCDYHVHAECQEGALPNCRHASSHTPGRTLDDLRPAHYWREGNLPTGAKCLVCRKSCWSGECLAGWKCEWCGLAVRPIIALLFLSIGFFISHTIRSIGQTKANMLNQRLAQKYL